MGVYIGAVKDDYSAMQGPAPSGFHVPLTTEWQAVYNVWTALGGGSSDGTNFGIALKLPFAGRRSRSSSDVNSQGTYGYYWSSSRNSASNAYYLNFISTALNPNSYNRRTYGLSVRCFKNFPVIPTSSWTKLYGTSIESGGIFWSSTDGLISLSSNGTTWITISDKNLGATQVWNNGDTLSEANCGKYYQRGNNYGFPFTGSVTTSSTQVDASTYGPGNYYSSDTFITYNGSWDSTDNGNLWGGVTGVMPTSLKNAYIGEYTIPMSGLLGYRPLQSDLNDKSGNENNASWYSGTGSFETIGGYKGARVTNSGSGDLLTTQHIVTPVSTTSKQITLFGWIRFNSVSINTNWNGIFSNDASGSSNRTVIGNRGSAWNNCIFIIRNGTVLGPATSISNNIRYCRGITDDGVNVKFYQNGVLAYTFTSPGTTGSNVAYRLGVGTYDHGGLGGTNGYVRHCAIYNRALTDDEMLLFYDITK